MEGEHEALLEAIANGDAETAETLMQVHVANSEQGLRAVLAAIRRRGVWK
jgi:DNA-binding FadR family transcriptional regulator